MTKVDCYKKYLLEREYEELEKERIKTISNMSEDIFKMSEALSRIKNLSVEGNIIREDLLGLLVFESDRIHQIDSLMIERRKEENSPYRRICMDTANTIIQ